MPSDIRVFVRWKEQSVFAGEDVQCTITFRNVADTAQELHTDPKSWAFRRKESMNGLNMRRLSNGGPSSPLVVGAVQRSPSYSNAPDRRHRATASLSITPTSAPVPRSPPWNETPTTSGNPGHKHQRSVSIVSLGGSEGAADVPITSMPPTRRPPGGHSRSASLQVLPKSKDDVRPSPLGRHPSLNHLDNARAGLQVPRRPSRRASGLRSPSISPTGPETRSRHPSPTPGDYRFPPTVEEPGQISPGTESAGSSTSPKISNEATDNVGLAHGQQLVTQSLSANRITSNASIDGSVRSSGEFYSASNHSTDTLASEQPTLLPQRPRVRAHNRLQSRTSSIKVPNPPETLVMGYAQVSASFTVDGSLVDQSPFEEVKKKGFMGGQGGGGVVGVETRKINGGLFGGFNLSSISESIGGLLGPPDMSSTREMKGVSSSRSVPLLSTPQSLLFVDLQLKPGEEKKFSYSYTLPKGLPASYKGKAIKISYNLIIGTQWAGGEKSLQKVRRLHVPFRVFSGVNLEGEILGHDLMHPYVVLRDTAKTASLDDSAKQQPNERSDKAANAFATDFLLYTDVLLDRRPRRQSSAPTMDDLVIPPGRDASPASPASKDLINLAIFRSNQASSSERSQNRFEISRNGSYVGVVVLNRPYHRLGETVIASIDFTDAQIGTLSLCCMLETCEKIEPSLALRSTASINRATRKIHASQAENTLYAQRVVFSPSIPMSATPTLYTSGISLGWQLRFEFSTAKTTLDSSGEATPLPPKLELLEEIGQDERGVSRAALEMMQCESFDVSIPLTVYGDSAQQTEDEEVVEVSV